MNPPSWLMYILGTVGMGALAIVLVLYGLTQIWAASGVVTGVSLLGPVHILTTYGLPNLVAAVACFYGAHRLMVRAWSFWLKSNGASRCHDPE